MSTVGASADQAIPPGALARLLSEHSVLAVCGPGGVGKTTVAAAVAIAAAQQGPTCVVTIDPARRLAQALGIPDAGDGPHEIALPGGGALVAVSLDAKRTFDGLVERYARSPDAADRILANRLYRELSSTMSGSHEYAAVEKLAELHGTGAYATIVLDTPPSRHAIDFLDAPGRITRLVDGRALKALRRDRGGQSAARRALGSASALAWKGAERLLGAGLLAEVSEFTQAFDGMYEGFRDRANTARELLAGPETSFVVVTTPDRERLEEATTFSEALSERGLELGCAIVNRVHPSHSDGTTAQLDALRSSAEQELLGCGASAALSQAAATSLAQAERHARADRDAIVWLGQTLSDTPLLDVPLAAEPPTTLEALEALAARLLARG